LFRDGVDVTTTENGTAIVLGAGSHDYICNISETQNYTAASASETYTVDKAPTAITLYKDGAIWSADENMTYPATPAINATIDVSALQGSVELTMDGSPMTNPVTADLGGGTYNWTGSFAGNDNYSASSVTVFLTVLPAAPDMHLYLDGNESDSHYNLYDIANFTATIGSGTVNIDSNLTGWVTQSGSSPLTNITTLSELGVFYVNASFAGDANYTPASVTYYITVGDPFAPVITILSPVNATYGADSIALNYTIADDSPISWAGYSLDGAANVTLTGDTMLTGFNDSTTHVLTLYANDSFGNMGSSDVTFGIDMTPPVITNISIANLYAGLPADVNVTVTDNMGVSTVMLNFTDTALSLLSGDLWNGTFMVPGADGIYTYTINATDFAGNSGFRTFKIKVNTSADPNATLDLYPPNVSEIWPTGATEGATVTIFVNVSDDTNVTYCMLYDNGTAMGTMGPVPILDGTVSIDVSFTGVGNHTVWAYCEDGFGNNATGLPVNFTVVPIYVPPTPGVSAGGVWGTGLGNVNITMALAVSTQKVSVLPGNTATFAITVTNSGPVPIPDINMAVTGAPAGWISVSPGAIAYLLPQTSTTYIVTINAPADATPGIIPLTVIATGSGATINSIVELAVIGPTPNATAPSNVTAPGNATAPTAPGGITGAILGITNNPAAGATVIVIAIIAVAAYFWKRPDKWAALLKTFTTLKPTKQAQLTKA
jgi:hypothetical protein